MGIMTRYRAERSVDPVPVGARFSVSVETGLEAHPALCTQDFGSFPGPGPMG